MSDIMTMGEAAKEIGVHKMTLYRWEKNGKLAELGIVPKRLRHGTKERQYTLEQVQIIKQWYTAVDESDCESAA